MRSILKILKRLVVNRTRDGGRSFDPLSNGLPKRDCYDLVYRQGLDVDQSGEWFAMDSTTGALWITENGGENWKEITTHLVSAFRYRFVVLIDGLTSP